MAALIIAKTAAETSADFTVTTGSGVSCYGMDGSEHVGKVEQKNSDGTYTSLKSRIDPNKQAIDVSLDGIVTSFVITKPGTYRLVKAVTIGTVGVDIDA